MLELNIWKSFCKTSYLLMYRMLMCVLTFRTSISFKTFCLVNKKSSQRILLLTGARFCLMVTQTCSIRFANQFLALYYKLTIVIANPLKDLPVSSPHSFSSLPITTSSVHNEQIKPPSFDEANAKRILNKYNKS